MVKAVTQALRDTLMQSTAITAQPRLIAEWEYNRYFTPTVTVTPDQTTTDADWLAAYDKNSITLPFRPTAGIARARVDSGVIPLSGAYRDPGTTRFYPAPDEPLYSYFASIQRTQLAASVNGDGYEFDAPIQVTVVYPENIATNKIVVGFETGYAAPQSFSIQVSPDGNAWQTVYSNPILDPDGTLTLWHDGRVGAGWGGTGWDVNPSYNSPVVIKGVRVVVYSMTAPFSHLDVLQVSPRLENDLTPYLVSYEVGMSQDSPAFITPLGKASSNTASVTLSNSDGRFNNENANSLYFGMIEKKVRFTLDLGISTTAGDVEYVREFTMWADSWGAQNNSTIDVQLKDSSVILQEQNMPSVFLQNTTVGQIIWQTLDTIGMTNYQYTRSDPDYGTVIPFYWPSDTAEASNPRWGRLMVNTQNPPTTTIWDELSALCEATQTALYFDEHDVLQIKAREQMYNTGKHPDWNLDAVKNGTKLPDIVNTQVDYSLTTNQVEVTYKPAAMAQDQNGFPKMEVVWQPTAPTSTAIVPSSSDSSGDTTVLLRASAMTKDLLIDGKDLWLHQAEALIWPYESDVNIQGEMIHYLGKEYAYYDATNNLKTAICASDADKAKFDALNDNLSWKNSFTGRFIVTARGKYGSRVADHRTQSTSYTSLQTSWLHRFAQALGTGWTTYNDGYITQTTPVTGSTPNYDNLCHVRMHQKAVLPQPNGKTVWYGGKFRFPGAGSARHIPDPTQTSNWRIGGMLIGADAAGNGYYLELSSTVEIDGWEQRQWRNELSLIALPAAGNSFQVPGTNSATTDDDTGNPVGNKGFKASLSEDIWFTIDVSYTDQDRNGNTNISVFLNGVFSGQWVIAPGARPAYTNQWRWGSYVRGASSGLDIDYLYAVGQDDTNPFGSPDQSTFLDLVSGGYQSKWARNNIVHASTNVLTQQPSGTVQYPEAIGDAYVQFDEFGPAVHEVRKFDIQFSDQYVPVTSSYLYLTNPQADCISYYSDASGASFMIANASRDLITINGEQADFTGSSVTYSLSIYGRVVYTAQNDSIKIVKNDAAIRKQGLIRTEFTSRYIQTEEMAGVIGDWITSLWAMGIDQVSADLFGNPLLQVGDLVTINYPAKGMSPATHQYFITSIKGTYDTGYKTSVVMRRARTL